MFASLGPKVKASYKKAVASGAVIFSASETEDVDEKTTLGIPFELRLITTLAKKPVLGDVPVDEEQKDPFSPPYVPDLYVAEDTVRDPDDQDDQGESFVVLLNKYCVTPRHFLLVTKEFERQNSPLTPGELVASYTLLKQLGAREKHLAFFNCGDKSGASQPHKHIQFIPLANGVAPFDSFIAAHRPENANAPFQLPLPYANFSSLISPPAGADLQSYFAQLFLSLLDIMIDHLRRLSLQHSADSTDAAPLRLSQLSFNVIITDAYIHLVPRTKERYILPSGESLSVNSLGYAGMVLVKSQAALDDVKSVGVLKILEDLGYPPVALGDTDEAEAIEE